MLTTRRATILTLAALAHTAGGVKHTGFLTDILCWDLVDAIDGANMPTEPEAHTVHCMRDIPECIDSGFGVLEGPDGDGRYKLKYKFDATGNKNALDLLKTTSAKANFIVTVEGDEDGNTLKSATVVEYMEESDSPAVPLQPRAGPAVLYIHFILMILAWGAVLPWGAALASRARKVGAKGAWFAAHWKLQVAGLVLMLCGAVAAILFAEEHTAHFISPHAQLGLAVIILGLANGALGAFRPHAPTEEGESKSAERTLFEGVHKNVLGRPTLVLGIVNIGLGIWAASSLNYDMGVIATAAAFAAVCVVPVGAYWLLDVLGVPLTGLASACFGVLGARGGSTMEGQVELPAAAGGKAAGGAAGAASQA